jgi:ribosomal protein S27E
LSLTAKADASVGMALMAGMFMFVAGFWSVFTFVDYVYSGEISAGLVATPCVILVVVAFVVFIAWNFPIVKVLLASAPVAGRRAAYFQVLFPILLGSFLLATPEASFIPSVTFAFPLLLIGAFAYPYTALLMKKWVKAMEVANLLYVECFKCTYVFEMHRSDEWIRCPYCGQVNMNPVMDEGEGKAAEDSPEKEPVSP